MSDSRQATGRIRFPVTDPEPPPRPWWLRLLVAAGAVAAAAAVTAVIVIWPFSPGTHPASTAAVRLPAGLDSGQVLTALPDGKLALASPDGTRLRRPAAALTVGQNLSVSPGATRLAGNYSQVISVGAGGVLTAHATTVAPPNSVGRLPAPWALAVPEAFANNGQSLVLTANAGDASLTADAPVATASLTTGTVTLLGDGDAPAGDPQSPGAFVAVPAPPVALSVPSKLLPDSRVELRQPAQPASVLATAASLRTDLRISASVPVQLVPLPDPGGDKVAVVVRPVTASNMGGIVVLGRTGAMIAASGLVAAGIPGTPAWSPDGQSLAWLGFTLHTAGRGPGADQATPVVWNPGSAPRVISGHAAQVLTTSAGQCVWSPAGTALACSFTTPRGKNLWAVARASATAVTTVPAPGLPVAWLAGGTR